MLKPFSRVQTTAFVCFFLFAFAALVFGQTKNLRNDLQSSFKKFSLVKINNQIARQKAQSGDALTIATDERTYQLNLTARDLRSSNYRAEETDANGLRAIDGAAQVTTFAGKVAGEESDSEVRVSTNENGVEGYFISGGEMFFIEPARRYSKAASGDDSIVYRKEDAVNPANFTCDVEEKIERGKQIVESAANNPQSPQATLRVVELATEADFEFETQLGGAAQANAEILNILNMVDGVYRKELGITISVVYQHAWTSVDPYTTATSTSALLTSFQNYWNTNFPASSFPRDAAHLFTGKAAFSGQGLAYVGVVCKSPSAAYGLDGRLDFSPIKFELTAHEIGHSFGATHAEAAQSCGNTIMNAMMTQDTAFTFCQSSRNEITTYVSSNNSCLNAQTTTKTAFDFDGDSRADPSVFRPSTGVWFLLRSASSVYGAQFGASGDKPIAADYDGDGKSDIAVFRGGVWFRFKSATNTYDGFGFGVASDLPVPADFDGDGRSDVAVFRPSTGEWFISKSRDGAFQSLQFGSNGDIPLPADFDADGKADFNVWRPSDGTWYRLNSGNNLSFTSSPFGQRGDKPVIADFDADNKADLVVYRPSNGIWYIIRSSDNLYYGVGFGNAEDIPVAADYDGDGKSDVAVYRPSNGYWYRLNSGDGAFVSNQFGASGDIPAPANQNY